MNNPFATNYRKPANTTEAAMQKITSLLKLLAVLAIAAYMVHILTAGQDNIINGTRPETGEVMDIREHGKFTPAGVLEKHQDECWTSEQTPLAELPGAAIVQFVDGKTVYVTNETPRGFKLVDAAFNEALAAVGFGDKTSDQIDVIALCK